MFNPCHTMKKLYIIIFSISLIACSKEQSSSSDSTAISLILLQHKWNIESVRVYPTADITGTSLYTFNPTGNYEDFRADGKVYTYGGSPVVSYDTFAFKLLPDAKTLLVYEIKNVITNTNADTMHIQTLTSNSFIHSSKNAVNEYAKWVLKR